MASPTPHQLKQIAALFSVLGDPTRLRILQCLRLGPLSVGDIHHTCHLKQANTSKHLRILREAGIVAPQRNRTTVYYKIRNPLVLDLCDLVCDTKPSPSKKTSNAAPQ